MRSLLDPPSPVEEIVHIQEAVSTASKWRKLNKLTKELRPKLSDAFVAQGDAFLARLAALYQAMPVSEAVPVREAPDDRQEASALSPRDKAFQLSLFDSWELLFAAAAFETRESFQRPLVEAIAKALLYGDTAGLKAIPATADVQSIAYAAELQAVGGAIRLGVSFELPNPRAVSYLQDRAANLVRGIDETTRGALRELITKAAREGTSYSKLAQQIRDRFDGFAGLKPQLHIRDRAELVAVTELGNGYEAGNNAMAQTLADGGLAMEKKWQTLADDRVSDLCSGNEAQGWILLQQSHASGHDCPLGHPACRCSERYRRRKAA